MFCFLFRVCWLYFKKYLFNLLEFIYVLWLLMIGSRAGQFDRIRLQIRPKGPDPTGSGTLLAKLSFANLTYTTIFRKPLLIRYAGKGAGGSPGHWWTESSAFQVNSRILSIFLIFFRFSVHLMDFLIFALFMLLRNIPIKPLELLRYF